MSYYIVNGVVVYTTEADQNTVREMSKDIQS